MSQQKPITEQILTFLRGVPNCDFEALVTRYPEFSWNELYLEVSRLNRHGLVKSYEGRGGFHHSRNPSFAVSPGLLSGTVFPRRAWQADASLPSCVSLHCLSSPFISATRIF